MAGRSFSAEERAFLIRKYMATCPVCGLPIRGGDLFDEDSIPTRPVSVTYCHHGKPGMPLHAVNMFLDSNVSVRSVEKADLLRIVPDA
ncbi:MAG: hypothetical protein ACTSU5_12545 [Promethearchaeota archaeon]